MAGEVFLKAGNRLNENYSKYDGIQAYQAYFGPRILPTKIRLCDRAKTVLQYLLRFNDEIAARPLPPGGCRNCFVFFILMRDARQ